MGELSDIIKQSVREAVAEAKGDLGGASKKEIDEITDRLSDIARRLHALEIRMEEFEKRPADATHRDILESVLGDEAKTLAALRKSIK